MKRLLKLSSFVLTKCNCNITLKKYIRAAAEQLLWVQFPVGKTLSLEESGSTEKRQQGELYYIYKN